MEADVVVRHLSYTSKMRVIVLELNHLIYIYMFTVYIRNEGC